MEKIKKTKSAEKPKVRKPRVSNEEKLKAAAGAEGKTKTAAEEKAKAVHVVKAKTAVKRVSSAVKSKEPKEKTAVKAHKTAAHKKAAVTAEGPAAPVEAASEAGKTHAPKEVSVPAGESVPSSAAHHRRASVKKEPGPKEVHKKEEKNKEEKIQHQVPSVPVQAPVVPVVEPLPAKTEIPDETVRKTDKTEAPQAEPVKTETAKQYAKELEITFPITVKDLAVKLGLKSSSLIMDLMGMRIMANLNQNLDQNTVAAVAGKYGYAIKEAKTQEEAALSVHEEIDDPKDLRPRAPIVTIMGHVDHGKTSILDAIRKSKVTESEFGGITQHMGAYRVKLPQGEITILDTPGHEAFTAMRARGASVTDIVVLVVAADDGVMPQTKEAIDHAKAAGVSIIVALNKIDKPQAEPDRVKKQLGEFGLVPEEWGGKTITVPVSAKTGQGINELLEMILLEAQMLELKASPSRLGRGVVIESKLVKNRGPVATLLVQNGTLRLNDNIIVGEYFGKIRAMFNDKGLAVTAAGPSIPVEVLGISGVPEAGVKFFSINDEKLAKELAEQRHDQAKQHAMQPVKRMGLEDLYTQIKEGKLKELNLILKSDAQGSAEAIKEALSKITSQEVQLNIIHEGIGNVVTSDVILAVASNALILGFNVVVDESAKEMVSREGQDVRVYNVIYELVNDIKAALEGMLAPKLKKIFVGRADIKKVFRLSSGTIAGCLVTKGSINRHNPVSLMRNGKVVFEGDIANLKRFKDDVREVEEGYECGITLKGFNEVMEGDVVEVYKIEKIARTLE